MSSPEVGEATLGVSRKDSLHAKRVIHPVGVTLDRVVAHQGESRLEDLPIDGRPDVVQRVGAAIGKLLQFLKGGWLNEAEPDERQPGPVG